VIDSLSGYFNAMLGEQLLMIHMQELLSYLNRREVLSLVVVSEQGIVVAIYASRDTHHDCCSGARSHSAQRQRPRARCTNHCVSRSQCVQYPTDR
jgi:hypothetical protein